MPCDYSKYPPNWRTEIRPAVLKRARNCCQRCGLPNHSTVLSKSRILLVDPQPYKEAIQSVGFYHDNGERAIVIVLTVAHLDHNTQNNHPSNLAALCQKCHLAHDAAHHAQNARATRDKRKGQLKLL